MAFPPPTLPTNRTNATAQQNTHPADHNAANAAINDIANEVQSNRVAKSGDTMSGNLNVTSGNQYESQLLRPGGRADWSNYTPGMPNFVIGKTMPGGAPAGDHYIRFDRGAAIIGSIAVATGGAGVVYNTSSDYRLKDELGPVVDALGRLGALRPIVFRWKDDPDGTEVEGFLAHEVHDVAPFAVTGEKDAVYHHTPSGDDDDPDAERDGQIIPQQLDATALVPLLVAAVQELAARVADLEA